MAFVTPQLVTIGVLATELKVPIHRVEHLLRTRPQFRAAARAGRVRLFDQKTVDAIRQELSRTSATRVPRESVADGGAA